MRAVPIVLAALLFGPLLAPLHAADAPPIDPELGKQLMHKFQAGEKLTPEEQAYLDRVRQEIRNRAGQNGSAPKGAGQKAAKTREPIPRDRNINKPEMLRTLVPLTELTGSYHGEDGGLYGGGRNEPPAAHLAAARAESGKIRTLDVQGRPADDGKIVLLSAGLSHTTMDFSEFKKVADTDPQKSPKVVVVDGAQGGKPAATWALSGAQFLSKEEVQRLQKEVEGENGFIPQSNRVNEWDLADGRLHSAGLAVAKCRTGQTERSGEDRGCCRGPRSPYGIDRQLQGRGRRPVRRRPQRAARCAPSGLSEGIGQNPAVGRKWIAGRRRQDRPDHHRLLEYQPDFHRIQEDRRCRSAEVAAGGGCQRCDRPAICRDVGLRRRGMATQVGTGAARQGNGPSQHAQD
jgi:hypothetical protein